MPGNGDHLTKTPEEKARANHSEKSHRWGEDTGCWIALATGFVLGIANAVFENEDGSIDQILFVINFAAFLFCVIGLSGLEKRYELIKKHGPLGWLASKEGWRQHLRPIGIRLLFYMVGIAMAKMLVTAYLIEMPASEPLLMYEEEHFVETALTDIEFDYEGRSYHGVWTLVDSYEGKLGEMPADHRGQYHEYSPVILFESIGPAPKLKMRFKPIRATGVGVVEFQSDRPIESGKSTLERRTIYFFDRQTDRLEVIGEFKPADTEEAIREKAKEVLVEWLEAGVGS